MNSRDQAVPIAIFRKVVSTACVCTLAAGLSVSTAATQDHVVVISESLTLEQVVERELLSNRFAKQIATYNGIDGISSILPIGSSLQIPQPYMVKNFGRVAFAKGDVVHTQRDLVVNPPVKGSMVYVGDIFSTGQDGFVSLSFNSGTSVNLQPDSRVSIVDVDCANETVRCVISLNADRGEVHSEVTPRPEGQPPVKFKVDTPFLSAAVRGTAFYVNVEDGADRIGVTRGLVAADANGKSNSLPRGKGMIAEAGVEPSVVDLLPAPDLSMSSERLMLSNEDTISWNALIGAEQYRFTIATDEAMAQPVSVQQVQKTDIQPLLTAPGQYYLTVAGIDKQQFVGLSATTNFSYASIDDTEALQLEIQRSNNIVDISIPDYSGRVELLISNAIDSNSASRRVIDDLSQVVALDLDPKRDWVFQARKVLGETSVSTYSNQYLLEAIR